MTKILKSNTVGIKEAAEILRCGGLVAFPTETVYGLGANGLSETAVKLIFKAKNRPDNNPLILHVSSLEMASEVAYEIPVIGKKLLEKFWPGPLTLVVKKSDKVPVNVSAGGKTVALRMPDHPIALSLIKEAGFPIAAPSANISGKPSPIEAGDVLSDLDGKIDAVIDGGKCRVGLESTVVDVTQNKVKILRHGAISLEQLAELLDYKPEIDTDKSLIDLHEIKYAPKCSIKLFTLDNAPFIGVKDGIVALSFSPPPSIFSIKLSSLEEYAAKLYSILREADKKNIKILYMEKPSNSGIGAAILDRLQKAESR